MRRRLIAANWKMHKTWDEAEAYMEALARALADRRAAGQADALPDVVVCPPYPALPAYRLRFGATAVSTGGAPGGSAGGARDRGAGEGADAGAAPPFWLGAQNMHEADAGAYTGEVSAPMLSALGVRYVILGHSERRRDFGEDAVVGAKVKQALRHSLIPIVCIGETREMRARGETESVLSAQLTAALAEIEDSGDGIVIAYEPVWAIGSGEPATPEAAEAASRHVRRVLAERLGEARAQAVRILYGGSVTADNLGAFLEQPNIDGALVGGASLDVEHFVRLIDVAAGTAPTAR